jgi:hypothetical protein
MRSTEWRQGSDEHFAGAWCLVDHDDWDAPAVARWAKGDPHSHDAAGSESEGWTTEGGERLNPQYVTPIPARGSWG